MYKLVKQSSNGVMTTMNSTEWNIGVTNTAIGEGNAMCSDAVLHCYSHPLLAVIFNPIHADIKNPILLEIECSEIINTDGLKHACKEQTPVAVLELPEVTTIQRVAFAIKCALLACKDDQFILWANKWLSGEYSSKLAAYSNAAYSKTHVAYAVAHYAADASTRAARSTVHADDAYFAAFTGTIAADTPTKDINNFFVKTIEFVIANY